MARDVTIVIFDFYHKILEKDAARRVVVSLTYDIVQSKYTKDRTTKNISLSIQGDKWCPKG